MSLHPAIETIEALNKKKSVPDLNSGDIIRVHQKIREGGKDRIQIFEGVVIKKAGGSGMSGTFTVRRVASGVGVERTFPLHSPKIAKIERVKASKVRRAKLYYLRELVGRKGRMKGENVKHETWEEVLESPEVKDEDIKEESKQDEEGTDENEQVEEIAGEEDVKENDVDGKVEAEDEKVEKADVKEADAK